MFGDQRLVGGHDRFAGGKCGFDGQPGRTVGPADQFDENVISFGAGHCDRIVVPGRARQIGSPVPGAVARAYRSYRQTAAGPGGDQVAVAVQQV